MYLLRMIKEMEEGGHVLQKKVNKTKCKQGIKLLTSY